MPTRRTAIGVVAAMGLIPDCSNAQPVRENRRLGILMPSGEADPETSRRLDAVLAKLDELGWKTGSNLDITIRYVGGDPNKAAGLARDLVAAHVNIILTAGTEASRAALASTRDLPIVMATIGDPVGIGLAQSLSHPGGNMTGFSLNASDLSAKRVEFARECIPETRRIAVVGNMSNDSVLLKAKSIAEASAAYGIDTKRFDISGPSAMSGVLVGVRDWRADVILTTEDAVVVANRDAFVKFATDHRIPVMSEFAVLADAGAVLSYGPATIDLWRRSAIYIDKILRGTAPGVLPIEQPNRFELVLNRRSANTLGLRFPLNIESFADRVIE
ncbi:ABC transporter substrate-binding protein [Methylobacterium sp. PvR107]|uniref:ABC transporter substrate-binding protein n=1 Tax=Methylobacterium sp. PvR107 TaxID=2806597 RepID=UPI001AE7E0D1|nr:ABC transporter substrate-binding protein [Methylobacterium sp. PvR107]MBP1181237.1 putative ABC transport system substrate-binding protein [Methylobacterium sp. PvR107]